MNAHVSNFVKSEQAPRRSLLMRFGWSIEGLSAGAGLLNAGYTTFGDTPPATLAEYLPAIPMLVLPLAELIRIPVISEFYHKPLIIRWLALAGVAAFTYPAIENWTMGLDRIAQMRIKPIVALDNAVSGAKAEQATAASAYAETKTRTEGKRAELRSSIGVRDQNIESLNGQLKAAGDAHTNNLDQIRTACRIVPGPCIVPRSQIEDRRYATETGDLRGALATAQRERQDFVIQIDRLVQDDGADAAQLAGETHRLSAAVSDAEKRVREAKNDNVIYRLAAWYFGTHVDDLTPEQIGKARWMFAVVPAFVIATIGPLSAIIHYGPDRQPKAPSFIGGQLAKLTRARRAYLARKRKTLPVSDKTIVDLLELAARALPEDAKPRSPERSVAKAEEVSASPSTVSVGATPHAAPSPTASSKAEELIVASGPSHSDAAHKDTPVLSA